MARDDLAESHDSTSARLPTLSRFLFALDFLFYVTPKLRKSRVCA
jgi:hypothetical protein